MELEVQKTVREDLQININKGLSISNNIRDAILQALITQQRLGRMPTTTVSSHASGLVPE
jgi:hypothetical protein